MVTSSQSCVISHLFEKWRKELEKIENLKSAFLSPNPNLEPSTDMAMEF